MVDQGEFLLQSDNEDLVEFMVEAIETSPYFIERKRSLPNGGRALQRSENGARGVLRQAQPPGLALPLPLPKTNGTAHELSRGGVDRIRTGESRFCKPLP